MIVITGASGLLGRFVVRKLVSESLPVRGLKRATSNIGFLSDLTLEWKEADVLDVVSLHDALKGASVVIHTAAVVSFHSKDAEKLHQVNVEGTKNVVNACLTCGVKRLIHVSSVAALGRQKGQRVVNEESKWTESPLNSPYAESKYLAELEVYRGQEEGLEIDIVNPSVILSRADWHNSSSQLFKYVWDEKPFYTNGSLNVVDVRDVVDVIYLLLKREQPLGSRLILNAGAYPMKEILTQLALQLNKRPPRIKVSSQLVMLAAYFESFKSFFLRRVPVVTRQSAQVAKENIFFDNQRVVDHLDFAFRPLGDTLQWCCEYYRQNATINN